MSPHRLERGPVTTDVDQRISNLARAYVDDVDNPDRDTVLWLLANWAHARGALRALSEAPIDYPGTVPAVIRKAALFGLEVQGE